MELADLTLTEQAEALRRAHCSSRDLIDAHLARIDRYGGHLHAYVDVYATEARALADAADEYFSPSWTAFQADRGRDFSVIVDGVSA